MTSKTNVERFHVSLELVKLFAEVAGDPNPIHQNEKVAREMGLEGPIAHGMFIYSHLLRRLDEGVQAEFEHTGVKWDLVDTKCRFHQYVPIGGTYQSIVEVG